MESLTRLEALYLERNRLAALPSAVFSTAVKDLRLSDNLLPLLLPESRAMSHPAA